MADELDIAAKFIYARLVANVTISGLVGTRIYEDVAPQGATFPYIIFASLAPVDLRAVGAHRIATNNEYLVKAVDQTSSYGGNVATLADAIDTVLHGSNGVQGSVTGGYVIHSYRKRPFRQSEIDNGVHYRSKGGIYAVMSQKS